MTIQHISIKQLYFYLVSFIALLIVLFNLQNFLITSSRYLIFKTAPSYMYQPPFFPYLPSTREYMMKPIGAEDFQTQQETQMKTLLDALNTNQQLSVEQHSMINDWIRSYEQWKSDQDNQYKQVMDSLIMNITALIIFVPVFLYHFRSARKQA